MVPDDASGLARDAEALRRERRALARRSRLVRMVRGRSGTGVGTPVVAGVLLTVGLFAALPVVLRPDLDGSTGPRPLARPTASPGTLGGLLPDVALTTPGGTRSARSTARPGVLLLVPVTCGCDVVVGQAVAQAREFTRNVRLVLDGRVAGAEAEAARVRREATGGIAVSATDPTGALAAAYAASGLTAVVVAADGVVVDVVRGVVQDQRLEPRFRPLLPPAGGG